jgi:beta-galactosidase
MPSPLAFSALRYTPGDLNRAEHTFDLRPRRNITVCVDYKQCGLGNGSCGPLVLDKYALYAGTIDFGFVMRPYFAANGDLAEQARQRLPDIEA